MKGTLNATMSIVSMTNILHPVGIILRFEDIDPNTCWPWQTWEETATGWKRTA